MEGILLETTNCTNDQVSNRDSGEHLVLIISLKYEEKTEKIETRTTTLLICFVSCSSHKLGLIHV